MAASWPPPPPTLPAPAAAPPGGAAELPRGAALAAAMAADAASRRPTIRLLSGEDVQVDLKGTENVGQARVLVGEVLELPPFRVRLVNSLGVDLRDESPTNILWNGCVTVYLLPNPEDDAYMADVLKQAGARSPGELGTRETLRLCNMKGLPDRFGDLTRLRELHFVAGNELSILPHTFGGLVAMETLHLDGNRLATLPRSFGKLRSLRTLHLASNALKTLPESFGELSSLQTLQLSQNRLETLPQSFGRLRSLQSLYLHENRLTSLPGSFGNLESLRVLYLRDNNLSALPDSMGNLKSLRLLYLRGNPLKELPPSVGRLPQLRSLEVDPCVDLLQGVRGLQRLAFDLVASWQFGIRCQGWRPPLDCSPSAYSAAGPCASTATARC